MSLITTLINLALHLDKHLAWIIERFGSWSYLIVFVMIFLETGLVFTPFLPGDSLIFAVGALSAAGDLNVWLLFILISAASILGDSANYAIGHFAGHKILAMNTRFIKKHHLDKTHAFYEKHGGETVIIARFIPIVRTFAPFLAGVGAMTYFKFLAYNIIGGIAWTALFLFGGFFFGNIPFVKEHFFYVIMGIVVVSLIPVFIEVITHYRNKKLQSKP
jgi:membrane-associated protein